MKASRILYALLIVGVAVWWLGRGGGGDEAQIRSQLEGVRELVSKEASEKALESAERSRRLAAYLASGFVLRLGPVGQEIRDTAGLTRPFVGLRQSVERLSVSFSEVEIEVAEDGRLATSSMVASLNATGSQPRRGSYGVTIRWVKDGRWLIEEMQVEERARGGIF